METLIDLLYKKREDLIDVLTPCDNVEYSTSVYNFRDKYGIVRTSINHLLRGDTPGIQTAADKHSYFLNRFKDVQPIKFQKLVIKSKYLHSKLPLLVEDSFGEMLCTPTALLSSKSQGIDSATNKTEYFLNKHNEILNPKYSYNNFKYITKKTKSIVGCPIHGEFKITPEKLSEGIGCFNCGVEKRIGKTRMINKNTYESTGLYVIELSNELEAFYKVGITSNTSTRFNPIKRYGYTVKIVYYEIFGRSKSLTYEKLFLEDFKKYKIQPKIRFEGDTECLSVNPLDYYYL